MVSRCGDILHYTIPEMMRWVNSMIIMFDFADENTRNIVNKYKEQYGNIETFESGVPNTVGTRNQELIENEEQGMYRRFNTLQGQIREKMLDYVKDKMMGGEKIDILIWMDSDEALNDSTKQTLIDFSNNDEKRGLLLQSIEVFNDLYHITKNRMNCHLRIIKPSLDYHVLPYRGLANIWGITKPQKQRCLYAYTHAYMLTEYKRAWRAKHWRGRDKEEYLKIPLWKTDKKATELSPEEITNIFNKKPNLTIGEYLKKHNLKV